MLAKFLRILDTHFAQTAGAVLFALTALVYGGLATNAFLYVSVLLHACNALLVALILRQLLRVRTWVALACGAICVVRPLHVNVVAALGIQDKLPSALFGLLCIW
ncbi:MAG TPA: hypothetical protein PKV72_05335, partial [Candidatus Peribacteria bacterium]|nr:hypothetical protein [Candidatus Peribacteria bacterium]